MKENRKKTRDLWFSSYLNLKGFKVIDFSSTNNRGEFTFNISDEDWKKYKLEFDSSEISKIKWGIEKLKDMVF